ncbi:MAG: acetate kinase [Oscillospiraceae bacterium]|nr:acetate kinase [Oscillospiraceae bacterium]
MNLVLVVNAGSSSLKYQLLNMDDESVLAKGNCDRIGIDGHLSHKVPSKGIEISEDVSFPTHTEAFEKLVEVLTSGEGKVIDSMSEISAVGHRVVHGGELYKETTLVTDKVIEDIDALSELAPVHNHPNALALRACKKVLAPGTPQVAVFDTAFHQTMPPKAYMFGLPYEDYKNYQVRKYGFHGTSHRFVTKTLADAMGKPLSELKIVSCHLGNGSSITAVDGGKSVDTTMGFTPLDGVLMGTRCGSVDPSAVTYVMEKHGFSAHEMSEYMNKKSGFLGMSGVGSDNREVCAAAAEGNERAQITLDILTYQIKKYIGGYAAAMNGLDAVLFTGGIGENSSEVRGAVCKDMSFMGIEIDEELNKSTRGKLIKISTENSKVEVWIVPTNEELLIARDTLAVVEANK